MRQSCCRPGSYPSPEAGRYGGSIHNFGGGDAAGHAFAHDVHLQPENFTAQMADGCELDQMRGKVFGIGFAGQAAAVAVGTPDEKYKVERCVGCVGERPLFAGIEFLELLRFLEVVQFFERGVGVGFDAPALQVAVDLLFEHVGQKEDADDASVAAHEGRARGAPRP